MITLSTKSVLKVRGTEYKIGHTVLSTKSVNMTEAEYKYRHVSQLATPAFLAAVDKSDHWDALMEDIMALYVDHVANLKARRHSLLRRLGWLAAPQKCGDHQPRVKR